MGIWPRVRGGDDRGSRSRTNVGIGSRAFAEAAGSAGGRGGAAGEAAEAGRGGAGGEILQDFAAVRITGGEGELAEP